MTKQEAIKRYDGLIADAQRSADAMVSRGDMDGYRYWSGQVAFFKHERGAITLGYPPYYANKYDDE